MTTLNGTQQRILEACFSKVPLDFILARAEQELGLTVREPDTTTPLKVGDKVRVLPRKGEWINQGPEYTEAMQELGGSIQRVNHVHLDGIVRLSGDNYAWMRHWLDKVEG